MRRCFELPRSAKNETPGSAVSAPRDSICDRGPCRYREHQQVRRNSADIAIGMPSVARGKEKIRRGRDVTDRPHFRLRSALRRSAHSRLRPHRYMCALAPALGGTITVDSQHRRARAHAAADLPNYKTVHRRFQKAPMYSLGAAMRFCVACSRELPTSFAIEAHCRRNHATLWQIRSLISSKDHSRQFSASIP
jgi:hypothetical protein